MFNEYLTTMQMTILFSTFKLHENGTYDENVQLFMFAVAAATQKQLLPEFIDAKPIHALNNKLALSLDRHRTKCDFLTLSESHIVPGLILFLADFGRCDAILITTATPMRLLQ